MSWRRRAVLAAAALLIVFVAGGFFAARQATPYVHHRIVQGLGERLDSDVTLEEVRVRLLPRPAVTGRGLVIRHRGRTDVPPLVAAREFSGATGWTDVLRRHVSVVTLDGLELSIPPRRGGDLPSVDRKATGRESPRIPLTVGRIEGTNARLTVMSKNPAKDPMVWDIFSLSIEDFSFDRASTFAAALTNPIPAGTIETLGSFGPWVPGEPSVTPVQGTYRFQADLGTIKGIAGALASEGSFTGPIERIAAKGTTHTPDLRIPKLDAAALPLETSFEAVIDGTNGDVELPRVDAVLGASRLRTHGTIAGTRGIKGKRVTLDVSSGDARIEDFLGLTMKTGSPMTGAVALQAAFDLPQGEADVIDKLTLKGQIAIREARFARGVIQDKVDELSRRGRGRPGDATIDDVVSDLRTGFNLSGGVMTLTDLTYAVRGATIGLTGTYALETGALNFRGAARLDAPVSRMVTGFKHFLLMPFDPMFRKGGAGTRLAIEVKGTVEKPDFNVNIGRTLKGQ